MKLQGKAKMLRIHLGENDKWNDKPLCGAIVEKCRELDIAGATVFRGVEGYGRSTLIHRSHLFSFSSDAPIMVSVVDSEEKVQQLIPYLDAMVHQGLVAMSEVEVITYLHQDGVRSQCVVGTRAQPCGGLHCASQPNQVYPGASRYN